MRSALPSSELDGVSTFQLKDEPGGEAGTTGTKKGLLFTIW